MKTAAYAKVNLTLEVFGKRSDGYHALRSVVMPVSLADDLEVVATDDGALVCDSGRSDDLCLKAAEALRTAGGSALFGRGAVICLDKQIPLGGGLGGGSADAAAVLRALNELWRVGLSRRELAEVGARVGSDVPALVLGGPVLMEGRGEVVTALPPVRSALYLVLVNPGIFCSTQEVYSVCRARTEEGSFASAEMCAALERGDLAQIAAALANDLESAACGLHPEISKAMVALREAGATGVLMSGSGSTVFGLATSAAEAERMAEVCAQKGFWARAVRTLS